jgi:dUTPase
MIIEKCAQPIWEVVDSLDSSERGEKGFGSTGYK